MDTKYGWLDFSDVFSDIVSASGYKVSGGSSSLNYPVTIKQISGAKVYVGITDPYSPYWDGLGSFPQKYETFSALITAVGYLK